MSLIIDLNAWLGVWPFRQLRDHTPEGLLRRMERCGIDKAAVSSIDSVMHRHVQFANEQLAESVTPYEDRLFPLATIDPTYAGWEEDLRHSVEDLGMRGVRLFPHYHGYTLTDTRVRPMATFCRDRDIPLFITQRIEDHRQRHHLDRGASPIDWAQIVEFIRAYPQVTVVITNATAIARSPLIRLMKEESSLTRWYVDISRAEVYYGLHRHVDHIRDLAQFIDDGGADRLVFGTHVPFSYAGPAMVKREILPVDRKTLRQISGERAKDILKL